MKNMNILLSGLVLLTSLLPTAVAVAANIQNPAEDIFVNVGGNTFPGIIKFAIEKVLLPLVGIVSMLFIILGGFRYITSAGNDEAAESGKKMIANAVIGLVIVILSYVIVVTVINATKGNVLTTQ